MKTITIKVSDEDYEATLRHLARDLPGRRIVAVHELLNPSELPTVPHTGAAQLREFRSVRALPAKVLELLCDAINNHGDAAHIEANADTLLWFEVCYVRQCVLDAHIAYGADDDPGYLDAWRQLQKAVHLDEGGA